jgi:hypothetical protein
MKLVLRNSLIFLSVCVIIVLALNLSQSARAANLQKIQPPPPEDISGGAAMARMKISFAAVVDEVKPAISYNLESSSLIVFDAVDFNSDQANQSSGQYHIPPDCHGAAGPNHVLNVVNTSIEWFDKSGTQQNSQSLKSFFGPLNPVNDTFDPKVVYDQYADRFVVVTLEIQDTLNDPVNSSRILLAVSDDNNPAGTWYYHAINSLETFLNPNLGQVLGHWADYPGFAIDEEVVYVICNMFTFGPTPTNGSVRFLWIVKKGLGTGGFYDGGTASDNIYSPYDSTAGSIATTTQPAHMFGAGPPNVGTFLVSYSGLTGGGNEFVQIIRIDNPASSPSFHHQLVSVGDIDNTALGLPDAPQMGSAVEIETNDRRALNAVWRNNNLWMSATVLPGSGPDAFQATAHWWQLNTTILNTIALGDQGDAGGEDIAPQTFTFFPSVMVDKDNNMCLGFSASGQSIFPGAYYAGRLDTDPPGTVQATQTLRAGIDFYDRRFGGALNRWGDYSGIALDPSNETSFWIYNEYAKDRGTILPQYPTQDGRWATAWGDFSFSPQAPANINVTPASFVFNVGIGGTASDNLTIQNTAGAGAQDLTWSITYQKSAKKVTKREAPVAATTDYSAGKYPPSILKAPIDTKNTDPLNNLGTTLLAGDNAFGVESANMNFGKFSLSAPDFVNAVAAQTGTGGFAGAGSFGSGDQSFAYQLDNDNYFAKIDTASGSATVLTPPIAPGTETWSGLAVDPTDGTLYGISTNVSTSTLSIIDPSNGNVTNIGQTGMAGAIALAIDGNGDMYSYDIITDSSFSVNKTTGAAASLGSIGFDANFGQGMAWDPQSDQIYMSAFNNTVFAAELRTLDRSNGTTTLVGAIGSTTPGGTVQFGWMGIPGTGGSGPCSWVSVNPTSGTTTPGGSDIVTISVDAAGLTSGTYSCTLTVASNDPNDPTVSIPMELNVGPTSIGDDVAGRINNFQLYQNYPNPFNPSTEIRYQLAFAREVQLTIYNSLGQQVRQLINEPQSAGEKRIEWNGLDDSGKAVSSGVYLYQLRAGQFSSVKKMVLMR